MRCCVHWCVQRVVQEKTAPKRKRADEEPTDLAALTASLKKKTHQGSKAAAAPSAGQGEGQVARFLAPEAAAALTERGAGKEGGKSKRKEEGGKGGADGDRIAKKLRAKAADFF